MKTMIYNYLVIEDDTNVWNNIEMRMKAFPNWQPCGFSEELDKTLMLIKKHLPQLIFMDWSIQGGNAFDILNTIEKIPHYQPYIIFFTGFQSDRPDIPEEVLNRYRFVQKYLVKPIHEKLTNFLAKYIQEAEQMTLNRPMADFAWVEDDTHCKKRIVPQNCMAIINEPTKPRCKRMIFCNSEPIIVRKTWEECISFFENHQIDYFIAHHRKSIVNMRHIKRVQNAHIYLNDRDCIEVSRQQWKELEKLFRPA